MEKNGISCLRIEETTTKTPDYKINVDGLDIVVEIKQVDPSKEEKALLREFEEKGHIVHGDTPGDRVRSKIKSAGPQLSKPSKGKCPSILVLYNNLPFVLGNPVEPYNIRVGMYGLETIVLSVPKDYSKSPSVIDRKFGPKRKLTEEHNTSISAVAVLINRNDKDLWLNIYHNIYAEVQLPLGLISSRNADEFILSENQRGEFQEWVNINSIILLQSRYKQHMGDSNGQKITNTIEIHYHPNSHRLLNSIICTNK